jgi:hypothetical protein
VELPCEVADPGLVCCKTPPRWPGRDLRAYASIRRTSGLPHPEGLGSGVLPGPVTAEELEPPHEIGSEGHGRQPVGVGFEVGGWVKTCIDRETGGTEPTRPTAER